MANVIEFGVTISQFAVCPGRMLPEASSICARKASVRRCPGLPLWLFPCRIRITAGGPGRTCRLIVDPPSVCVPPMLTFNDVNPSLPAIFRLQMAIPEESDNATSPSPTQTAVGPSVGSVFSARTFSATFGIGWPD